MHFVDFLQIKTYHVLGLLYIFCTQSQRDIFQYCRPESLLTRYIMNRWLN